MKKIAADRNYLLKEAAEYKGRKVSLRKPFRTPKGPKKFSVYVRNKKGNVIKVNFGDPDMEIKRDDPDSRRSFRARHKCSEKKDETKPGYWSCKMWGKNTVKSITKKKKKKAFEETKMKKIAADKSYRIFKGAQRSNEEHANYVKVKQRLLKASQGAPGRDAAFYVFEAIRDTALIHSVCRNDNEEGEKNKYKSVCMPHVHDAGTLEALRLTEDVMTGMKSPVWDKYSDILFRSIKKHAPNSKELIGWIKEKAKMDRDYRKRK